MKKLKYLVIMLFAIIFVTGCGSNEKTLTCTNTEEESGLKMKQTIVMNFKDDKINNVKMTVDNEATDDLIKENWDMFASALDQQFNTDEETKGVKLTTSNDKDTYNYSVSIEVDLNEANEESLALYDMEDIADSDESYEDVKKSAEEDGFTCK